jgi:predicted ATPase
LESKGIPPTAPLAEQLNILIQAGLLSQSETEQEIEYAFTSALIHEAARASLVRADRRQLHQTIANTLEAIYAERLDEFAPLLADHFHHAGSDMKAMQYYAMAGNLALSRYANAEAARFYSNSLAIMRSLFRKSDEPEYLHLVQSLGELYQKRGQALWWSGSYNQALENYSEMEAFARQQGDARLELPAWPTWQHCILRLIQSLTRSAANKLPSRLNRSPVNSGMPAPKPGSSGY